MGSVWAAVDDETGQSVALKFLEASNARPELAERLVREAKVSTLVRHPALARVHEVIDFLDRPVLVMELLTGETLRAWLTSEPKHPLEVAAALMLPVAEALVSTHEAGIVHRDLKPENLFLASKTGRAPGTKTIKVLDFGIAKFVADREGPATPLTALGTVLGTPPYMAPEQALGSGDIDERADVWALGVILYELVCGFRPLEAESKSDAIRRLLSSGIVPVEAVEPELPLAFSALVGRMLTRRLDQRERNLVGVVEELRVFAASR